MKINNPVIRRPAAFGQANTSAWGRNVRWGRKSSRALQQASASGRKAEIDQLADKARLAIKAIGGALALGFGWLQLKDLPLIPLLESTQAGFVLKIALTLYYFSWVFGANFDVGLQQAAFLRDRHRGNLGLRAIAAIAGFGVVAAILLWVSNDEQRFSMALIAFVVVNVVGWHVLAARVSSICHASLILAEGDYFEIERIRLVQEFISGNWQRHRFLVMFLIAAVGAAVCFVPEVRATIRTVVVSLAPDLREKGAVVDQLLPASVFLMFLVIAESWIWTMRAKTRLFLALIDDLRLTYEMRPIAEGEARR